MTAYRIYVAPNGHQRPGDIARQAETIAAAAKRAGLDGYTLTRAIGVWLGESEPSYIIDIVDIQNLYRRAVFDLARQLRAVWAQEAVLVTATVLTECALITKTSDGGVL